MGVLTTLARAAGLIRAEQTPDAPSPLVIPSRSATPQNVSTDDALSLGGVFRAVQVLTTGVSQLSLGVWRGDTPLDASQIPSLITNPDLDGEELQAFLQTAVTSLALNGNAYWKLERADGPGSSVLNAENISPLEVSVHEDPRRRGRVSHYTWNGQRLETWQVRHLKFLRIAGRMYGIGPIQAARADLRGGLDVRDYAATWFTNSGQASGVLSTDQRLTQADADEYRKTWYSQEAGRVRIIGSGLTYSSFALSPSDAQWLEVRKFTVTEIARLFGIPSAYVLAAVDGTSQTYQNQEQVDIAFVRYTLMAYLREIEAAFTALTPRGQRVRFSVGELLRSDTKTRYESHKLALEIGLYDAAHAQRVEGLPITTSTPTKELTDA